MIRVTLLTHTPNPEQTVAAAAKLCYSPASIASIQEKLTDDKVASFVDMLAEIGHESPIEHASFTFGIEGVSRSLLAQITRHRIASFSVQSQRYVAEDAFEYVLPPEIEAIPEAAQEYRRAMEEDQAHYERLTALLMDKHEKAFLAEGMEPKAAARAAQKKAIEDARFVLPNACTTKMVVTMNARSLMNFFRHRCCNRAQWEIRQVAEQMLFLCRQAAPHLFKNAGPSCLTGPCPEGKMSCGKMREMREKYAPGKERPEWDD
ncbi:MAG: FAD-dependent thymidylate synthase [Acutalibacteraceae bacterium]|jgi:thymidylate synthase (FAD)